MTTWRARTFAENRPLFYRTAAVRPAVAVVDRVVLAVVELEVALEEVRD